MSKKTQGRVCLLEPPKVSGGTRAVMLSDRGAEFGSLEHMREGVPINGKELLEVRKSEDVPGTLDVMDRTSFSSGADLSGPPMVASKEYRDNYDRLSWADTGQDEGMLN